jgi:hypothetical protein
MTSNTEKETPDPHRTFWEGLNHVGDYLLHHFGHGTTVVSNWAGYEIFAVAEVASHSVAAAACAEKGDWEGAANHSATMANSAAIFATGGILGVFEATADAAALAHHLQGERAPTWEEAQQRGFKTIGEYIGDQAFDTVQHFKHLDESHADKLSSAHTQMNHQPHPMTLRD